MTVLTLQVLAGAYRGGRTSLEHCLTHSLWGDAEKTLCGRIRAEQLADENADLQGVNERPTCGACLSRDPRFARPERLP